MLYIEIDDGGGVDTKKSPLQTGVVRGKYKDYGMIILHEQEW